MWQCKGCGKKRARPVAHDHKHTHKLCGPWKSTKPVEKLETGNIKMENRESQD